MSAHPETVHAYIELRNFLGQSHIQPNEKFEVEYVFEINRLYIKSTKSNFRFLLASLDISLNIFRISANANRFEDFIDPLIDFLNTSFKNNSPIGDPSSLASVFTKKLGLENSYGDFN